MGPDEGRGQGEQLAEARMMGAGRPLDTALRPSRPQGRGAVSKEILATARLTTS